MPGTEAIRSAKKTLRKIRYFAVKQVLMEAGHFTGLLSEEPSRSLKAFNSTCLW